MSIAHYKDLCIDATDAHAMAQFWSVLLGWEANLHDDGDASLRDADGRTQVWIDAVPEPVLVKNRLHLDVNAESIEAARAAGAHVLDDTLPWTLMRDPDGQQLCVFVREAPIERRFYELVWDVTGGADDAHRLAQWWGEVLGAGATESGEGFSWIEPVDGAPFESIVFQAVPEEKTTKNRVHIDVTTDDLAPLVAAGASVVRQKGDDGIGWTVMHDPAGNEFCAFTPDE